MWVRGLNFLKSKYRLTGKDSFLPHLRSNYKTAIPTTILGNFECSDKEIVLVEIKDVLGNRRIRIKKLFTEGNSKTISLQAEKDMQDLEIRVLQIASERGALSRDPADGNHMMQFIPTHTKGRGRGSPIYVFDNNDKMVVGGYYKKDIVMRKEIVFDDSTVSALGLYFADGGKTASSFTNVWPDAMNCVLGFFERFFGVEREGVKATICCSNEAKDKKDGMEGFWKSQTGVSNFAKTLHFNKNIKSPQGILELYFCSEVLKEVTLNIMNSVISSNDVDKMPLIRGVLSGDGSPIQQTPIVLNHQITFDEKSEASLDNIFSGFRTRKVGTQPRKVICPDWKGNKELLFSDPYMFNRNNRAKFAKRFLLLPRTIKEDDKSVREFKETTYPKIVGSLLDHYRTLHEFGLVGGDALRGVQDEYNIC